MFSRFGAGLLNKRATVKDRRVASLRTGRFETTSVKVCRVPSLPSERKKG